MRKLIVFALLALAFLTATPAAGLLAKHHTTISADGGNGGTYGKGGG